MPAEIDRPEPTVGQLVREIPSRARVFETFQIDYCYGGKLTLSEACQRRQVEPAEVIEQLKQCDAEAAADDQSIDADAMSLLQLVNHIEQTHHAYLRGELPRLDRITEKVARVHGEKEPRLRTVRQAFLTLRSELEPHMMKEERILFPMVRQLVAPGSAPEFHCGSLAGPILQMEHEHDHAGDALATIRAATDDFSPPTWACNTYRAMLDGLKRLEKDMHQHVHKENNILFPKALQLEADRKM